MNVRRYRAVDMREALRQIREMQGEDAVILSSRRIEGGIEVVAALDLESLGATSERPFGVAVTPLSETANDGAAIVSDHRFGPGVGRDRSTGSTGSAGPEHGDGPHRTDAIDDGASARQGRRDHRSPGVRAVPFGAWAGDASTSQADARDADAASPSRPSSPVNGAGPRRAALWAPDDASRGVESTTGSGEPDRSRGRESGGLDGPTAAVSTRAADPTPGDGAAPERHASSAASRHEATRRRAPHVDPWPVDPALAAMRNELRSLRLMLAERHAMDERTAWAARHPLAAEVVLRLTEIGFDEAVARGLAASVVEGEDFATAWAGVRRRLAATLPIGGAERLDDGGVLAVIGPHGVGKTTMLGRLALRRVERHGRASVTLVTLDHERFGAGRQLQAFASVARVPLWSARDLDDLARRIAERLAQAPGHLFLLDTAGVAPSAIALGHPVLDLQARSVRHLGARGHGPVTWSNWLTVRASLDTRSLRELTDAVTRWPVEARPRAALVTHLDELQAWGGACSALIGARLPIAFLGDGSRLTEPLGRVDGDLVAGLLLGTPARWRDHREAEHATARRCEGAGVRWGAASDAAAQSDAVSFGLESQATSRSTRNGDGPAAVPPASPRDRLSERRSRPPLAPLAAEVSDRSWLRRRALAQPRPAANAVASAAGVGESALA